MNYGIAKRAVKNYSWSHLWLSHWPFTIKNTRSSNSDIYV